MYGMARDQLRSIARTNEAAWSIQDGKVDLIPLDEYKPGMVAVVNQYTGMVGLPEQTANGIKVRMLLNPSIKIGCLMQLDNESIQLMEYSLNIKDAPANLLNQQAGKLNNDGYYYVMLAEHTGDTRGNDYYTDVICLALDATMPVGLINKQGVPNPIGVKPYG